MKRCGHDYACSSTHCENFKPCLSKKLALAQDACRKAQAKRTQDTPERELMQLLTAAATAHHGQQALEACMLGERSRPCCCRVLHLLVHQKQQHTAVLTCCTLKQQSLKNDIGTQHTQERKHRLAPVSQARSTLSRQLSTNLTNSGTTRSQKPRQTMELGCFDMQCTPAPCHKTKSNHHRALNPRVQPNPGQHCPHEGLPISSTFS